MTEPTDPQTATIAAIESDIEEARAELSATIDELSERLNPKNQARHAAESAKASAAEAAERTRSKAQGHEREILMAVGAVLVLLLLRRRRRRAHMAGG
jgi:hypothetical protein